MNHADNAKKAAVWYLAAHPNGVVGTLPLGTTKPLVDAALLLRHGGNSNHSWRVTKACATRELGDRAFTTAYAKIRQGGVALWFGGEIVRIGTAPRLRTRW